MLSLDVEVLHQPPLFVKLELGRHSLWKMTPRRLRPL